MHNEFTIKPYPLFSTGFMKAFAVTMRPYLLFVSGITGLAGLAFSAGSDFTRFLLVGLASFLSYGFGQALTDCFQTDTDAISSPYRPLVQGLISVRDVLFVSMAGLLLCVTIFTYYSAWNIAFGGLSALGLLTYTWFKKRYWAGPFYNAWIVAVLFLMGYITSPVVSTGGHLTLLPAVISVFSGYANFVLGGYFKDIEADRQTGYFTLPVTFGRKISAYISDLFALGMILPAASLLIKELRAGRELSLVFPAMVFLMISLTVTVPAQVLLHRVRTDESAHKPIALIVHGYILCLSAVSLLRRPEWWLFLAGYYFLFIAVLKFRPSESQI